MGRSRGIWSNRWCLLSVLMFSLSAVGMGTARAAAAAPGQKASKWTAVQLDDYGTLTAVSGVSSSDLWAVGYIYDQPQDASAAQFRLLRML